MVSAHPLPPPIKPALKWAGGKRWLLPCLQTIWQGQKHRRLVEPFVGSMSVCLGLQPERALLNDRNVHLINFCRWLQRGLTVDLAMLNEQQAYYACRQRFNELVTSGGQETPEAAQLFYYLNRTGFNGLCRFNNQGRFNVPFGRYKTINYAQDFSEYPPVLKDWVFVSGDFEALSLEDADFIYADPPYDVEFTKYSQTDFTWEDQVRVAHWLARHSGPVLVSNQATPRILALYQDLGFGVEILEAPRRIACNGDRTPAQEMLAYRGLALPIT